MGYHIIFISGEMFLARHLLCYNTPREKQEEKRKKKYWYDKIYHVLGRKR